jgi:hypothetical protein
MRSMFFGGSLHGQERPDVYGYRFILPGETYVRDGDNGQRSDDPDGPQPDLIIFYRLESSSPR